MLRPVKVFLFIIGGCILLLGPETARAEYGGEPGSLQAGNIMLITEGALAFPSGELLQLEEKLTLVHGRVVYEDGTSQDSQMNHLIWRWAVFAEYLVNDAWSVQAGLGYKTYEQTISAGGGSYETKEFARATLLEYYHPFLGVGYYFLNEPNLNMNLWARAGCVTGGSLLPLATSFAYAGLTPDAFTVSGVALQTGLGMAVVFDFFVLGCSLSVSEDLLSTSEEIYSELEKSFGIFSIDLNAFVGLKF